jgi:hypothetical protein
MRWGGLAIVGILCAIAIGALLWSQVRSQATGTPWGVTGACFTPIPLTPLAIEELPGDGKWYTWDDNHDGAPDVYSTGGISVLPCVSTR